MITAETQAAQPQADEDAQPTFPLKCPKGGYHVAAFGDCALCFEPGCRCVDEAPQQQVEEALALSPSAGQPQTIDPIVVHHVQAALRFTAELDALIKRHHKHGTPWSEIRSALEKALEWVAKKAAQQGGDQGGEEGISETHYRKDQKDDCQSEIEVD